MHTIFTSHGQLIVVLWDIFCVVFIVETLMPSLLLGFNTSFIAKTSWFTSLLYIFYCWDHFCVHCSTHFIVETLQCFLHWSVFSLLKTKYILFSAHTQRSSHSAHSSIYFYMHFQPLNSLIWLRLWKLWKPILKKDTVIKTA